MQGDTQLCKVVQYSEEKQQYAKYFTIVTYSAIEYKLLHYGVNLIWKPAFERVPMVLQCASCLTQSRLYLDYHLIDLVGQGIYYAIIFISEALQTPLHELVVLFFIV